jgi:hypothetical protein
MQSNMSKQTDENGKPLTYWGGLEKLKQEDEIIDISDHDGIGNAVDNLNNEPPQETLEEFINSQPYYGTCTSEYLEGIEEGAKWQAKRMYSIEEVIEIVYKIYDDVGFSVSLEDVLEQFKKK